MRKKDKNFTVSEEELFEIIEHMCDDLDILISAYEAIEDFYTDGLSGDREKDCDPTTLIH